MSFNNYDNDYVEDEHWGSSTLWTCNVCQFKNHPIMPQCEICSAQRNAPRAAVSEQDKLSGARATLLGESLVEAHLASIAEDKAAYVSELNACLDNGVSLSSGTKARAAAALWAEGLRDEFDRMLADHCGLTEVVALVKLLDAPRRVRALKRRRAVLEQQGAKAATLRKVDVQIDRYSRELMNKGSVSGSLAKRIRAWCKAIPADRLEFFLLNFPKDPWKEMADIVHSRPGDFALDYFLHAVFGASAPVGTLVADAEGAGLEDIAGLLEQHPSLTACYSYLRKRFEGQVLPRAARAILAEKAPLEDVIWFYEELNTGGGDSIETIVAQRLDSGERLDSAGRGRANYGKLMERLLTFREMGLSFAPALMRYAQEQIEGEIASVKSSGAAQARAAVLGDCSGSMEVAVKTASIIGSLLSAALGADLSFFNRQVVAPPCVPKTVDQVLRVVEAVKARGATAPAAALLPYLEQRKCVDLFVVVSDEEENTPANGMLFAEMFQRYRREVNPKARVFLVSFLSGPSSFLGKMRAALRTKGIEAKQFRLDGRRPDLSKLPHLMGMVALEAASMNPQPQPEPQAEDDDEEHKGGEMEDAVVKMAIGDQVAVDETEETNCEAAASSHTGVAVSVFDCANNDEAEDVV